MVFTSLSDKIPEDCQLALERLYTKQPVGLEGDLYEVVMENPEYFAKSVLEVKGVPSYIPDAYNPEVIEFLSKYNKIKKDWPLPLCQGRPPEKYRKDTHYFLLEDKDDSHLEIVKYNYLNDNYFNLSKVSMLYCADAYLNYSYLGVIDNEETLKKVKKYRGA